MSKYSRGTRNEELPSLQTRDVISILSNCPVCRCFAARPPEVDKGLIVDPFLAFNMSDTEFKREEETKDNREEDGDDEVREGPSRHALDPPSLPTGVHGSQAAASSR